MNLLTAPAGAGMGSTLIMMVLILLSLGLLRKVDPEGEGGSMI